MCERSPDLSPSPPHRSGYGLTRVIRDRHVRSVGVADSPLRGKTTAMQTTGPVAEEVPGIDAPRPQTLALCHEVIDTLAQCGAELQHEVARLHERVTLNCKTSYKPPPSDGPGSANRAQRLASHRKRGAQKGHPGTFRALVEKGQLDQIIDCPAPEVCGCDAPVTPAGEPTRHQVFEVPVARAQVGECRLHGGCWGLKRSGAASRFEAVMAGTASALPTTTRCSSN